MLLRQPSEKIPLLFSGPVSSGLSFEEFGAELRRELEFLQANPCSLELERFCPLNFLLLFPLERRFAVLSETLCFEDWLHAAAVRSAQFLAGIRNLTSDDQIHDLMRFPVIAHASGLAEFVREIFRVGSASLSLLTAPVRFRDAVLLNFIARGSTSAVYRAEWNEKICAFKQSIPGMENRFRGELSLFAELENQPNFPVVYHTFSGGQPFCLMELCRTGLRAEKNRHDDGFLNALHFLHERGILHGDIRRSNLGFSAAGTPVLIDFSHAKRFCEQKDWEWKMRKETNKLKCLLA